MKPPSIDQFFNLISMLECITITNVNTLCGLIFIHSFILSQAVNLATIIF